MNKVNIFLLLAILFRYIKMTDSPRILSREKRRGHGSRMTPEEKLRKDKNSLKYCLSEIDRQVNTVIRKCEKDEKALNSTTNDIPCSDRYNNLRKMSKMRCICKYHEKQPESNYVDQYNPQENCDRNSTSIYYKNRLDLGQKYDEATYFNYWYLFAPFLGIFGIFFFAGLIKHFKDKRKNEKLYNNNRIERIDLERI